VIKVADRDEKGHFKKGWAGGPGRPKAKTDEYKKLLEPHMPEILDKLVGVAKSGDLTAIRLILERMYPVQAAAVEDLAEQVDELRELVRVYNQAA
jgi:hypothetical protein